MIRRLIDNWHEREAHFTYHLAVRLGIHPKPTKCPWCGMEE